MGAMIAMERLRTSLRGELVLPIDAAYETARRVWNGMVDKRPALIAYCAGRDDVVAALAFARQHDLPASVRAGGHNVAGNSLCENGLVVDLSRMKAIHVDPVRRVARAAAGLTLAEFDAATQAHGLATTMGVNSDTGIAGLTLGGGIGRLGRKHGLACDNVLAAEIVTADGRLLRASEDENADLHWALRGGGGNFGVVTAFEYRLHPVGPTVLAGSLLYGSDAVRGALRHCREFSRAAPDELCVDAALVSGPDGRPAASISPCWCGTVEAGLKAVAPLRAFGAPVEDRIGPVAYTQMQKGGDELFARGRRFYWKAQFLPELSEQAVDALVESFAGVPSPLSVVVLQQLGGAVARVAPDATAFVHRNAAYDCFPIAIWEDPADDERNIRWARELYAAMQPYSSGVYVNNLGDEGEERVRSAYGANYARLQRVKARYDPTNFFRLNQNVAPMRAPGDRIN